MCMIQNSSQIKEMQLFLLIFVSRKDNFSTSVCPCLTHFCLVAIRKCDGGKLITPGKCSFTSFPDVVWRLPYNPFTPGRVKEDKSVKC